MWKDIVDGRIAVRRKNVDGRGIFEAAPAERTSAAIRSARAPGVRAVRPVGRAGVGDDGTKYLQISGWAMVDSNHRPLPYQRRQRVERPAVRVHERHEFARCTGDFGRPGVPARVGVCPG